MSESARAFIGLTIETIEREPELVQGDTLECAGCGGRHTLETGAAADTKDDPEQAKMFLVYLCQGSPVLVGLRHPVTKRYHDVRRILPPGVKFHAATEISNHYDATIDDNADPDLPRSLPELMAFILTHYTRIFVNWRTRDGAAKRYSLNELPPHVARDIVGNWIGRGFIPYAEEPEKPHTRELAKMAWKVYEHLSDKDDERPADAPPPKGNA